MDTDLIQNLAIGLVITGAMFVFGGLAYLSNRRRGQ
jgi:hypothetical protein